MKRIILIVSLIIITSVCYVFMNRNYDPLARYSYDDPHAREMILKYMDEREIKYICDYSISPNEFMDYIELYNFRAMNIEKYNYLKNHTYNLYPWQIVNVVEKIDDLGFKFDKKIEELKFLSYEDIMGILNS